MSNPSGRFGWAEEILPKQAGQDPDEWLRAAVETSFALFKDPAVRAGTPGLLAVIANDERMRETLWTRAGDPVVSLIEGYLPHIEDAERRRAAAQALLAVLAGAPLFLQLFGGDTDPATRTVLAVLLKSLGAATD
jgi:hypothetical protein